MKFLFKEIFKRIKFRYIILILITLLVFSYISQYIINVNLILKSEFPLDKSPNPQATEHFIKAFEYKMYIGKLHKYINHNNFIMKPFLNKMNEEYEKGKSLLPKNSAEDVYWYVFLYRSIYGIGGVPDDYDMSMAFKTTLSKEDYKKHYDEIVDKINRFVTNDFNYDVPRITEYKFEFISDLVNEYDKTVGLLSKEFFASNEYKKDLNEIYKNYKQFRDKYLPIANKQDRNNLIANHDEILFFLQFTTYTEYIQKKQIFCNDEKYKLLLTKMKELKNSTTKEKQLLNTYLSNIFEKSIWLYQLTLMLEKCPNLEEEAKEILMYFHPKIKQKYEEDINKFKNKVKG